MKGASLGRGPRRRNAGLVEANMYAINLNLLAVMVNR